MLNALRFALVTPEIIATIDRLRRRVEYTDGLQPTELFVFLTRPACSPAHWNSRYPRRDDVEISNTFKLKRIKSEAHDYKAKDLQGWDHERGQYVPKDRMERLLSRLVAPESLTLKVCLRPLLSYGYFSWHAASVGRSSSYAHQGGR